MGQNHRIMVAVADTETREKLCEYLERQRYRFCQVDSVEHALERYADLPIGLVISEYAMCGRDGVPLTEAIHRIDSRARFLLITCPGQTTECISNKHQRVAAFLNKPINPDELEYFIRGVLGMPESMPNRREHDRFLFHVETQIRLINPFSNQEGRPVVTMIRDLSRSGISMITRQLFPVPSMLKLGIRLAEQNRTINTLAKSVSCTLTQIDSVYRLGAKFVGLLPPEVEDIIARITQQRSEEQSDVFMGKSFQHALQEWIEHHPEDFRSPREGSKQERKEITEQALHVWDPGTDE